MDWKLAIDRNRAALTAVIAGLAAARQIEMSRPAWCAVRRVVYAAEAALRRLIVIAAAVLKPSADFAPATRPLPDFSAFGRGDAPPAFPLIDPRKTFEPDARWDDAALSTSALPRISVPGLCDPTIAQPEGDTIDATALARRIARLDHALNTLPRQARRLIRLMARRKDAKPGPGRVGPIRPGSPPGARKRCAHPVDHILTECHALARDLDPRPP